MSLLSDKDKLDIRNALKSATDSFFVTPVKYELAITKLARFNEDDSFSGYQNYDLSGLVEYEKSQGTDFSQQGAINKSKVTVSFNVEDLILLGLYDTENHKLKFRPEKDYMTTNGSRYKVLHVALDGPLDRQNILAVVTGELVINRT